MKFLASSSPPEKLKITGTMAIRRFAYKRIMGYNNLESYGWVHPIQILETNFLLNDCLEIDLANEYLQLGIRFDKLEWSEELLNAHTAKYMIDFNLDIEKAKIQAFYYMFENTSPRTSFIFFNWNLSENFVTLSSKHSPSKDEIDKVKTLFNNTFDRDLIET